MAHLSSHILFIFLILLFLISAFFSAAETGMMAINRYRLRHLARKGNSSAKRVNTLLERPDRLLGMILTGNTLANILAASIATILVTRNWGDLGITLAPFILTLLLLIFSETAPKTFAALYPQRVAFATAWLLQILLRIFYPIVWFINYVANTVLKLLGVSFKNRQNEALSIEELRTVVREATSKIGTAHQQMLLQILELEKMTVEDVMLPRNQIVGIDLSDDLPKIIAQLKNSHHAYLPLYRENIDNVIGIINMRKLLVTLTLPEFKKDTLVQLAEEVYFIPEVTLLNQQLLSFQREHKTIGLVVDEYGDIEGLVTLQDILEEIVGEFALEHMSLGKNARTKKQKDGSIIVDGGINIRELNRATHWDFPANGPKTLSGLIVEYLETIPAAGVSLQFEGYRLEVLEVSDNKIQQVRIWPKKS